MRQCEVNEKCLDVRIQGGTGVRKIMAPSFSRDSHITGFPAGNV
jgi:hypothetical protein